MTIQLLEGDCRDLSKGLADGSVDIIFTDPPYTKESVPLYSWLAEEAARLLVPGGYCFAFTGTLYLADILARMSSHLQYYWLLGIKHNGPWPTFHYRRMFQAYKAVAVFSKGEGRKHMYVRDFFTHGRPDKRWHKWGQRAEFMSLYLSYFARPEGLVLDPFCGGGTTAYVCSQLGLDCVTFEIDPIAAASTRKRLENVQQLLPFEREAEQLIFGEE